MNMSKEVFKELLITKLESTLGKSIDEAKIDDVYYAISHVAKDYIAKDLIKTNKYYKNNNVKQVYYFSLEFLMGKSLKKNLNRLELFTVAKEVLADLGYDMADVTHVEADAGLGNGGLGRLASCFLDSLAACSLPGHGNGIRYKHGLFKQKISNGYQVEESDNWLKTDHAWETKRASEAVEIKFYGTVWQETYEGKNIFHHDDYQTVIAIPYDIAMLGYENHYVNTLRLWSAEPKDGDFDLKSFSSGEYNSAVAYRQTVRAISDVLYPDDSNPQNKELRLKQQYFFVCAGITNIINRYIENGGKILELANFIAIHINDTHPALAVPELMRVLIDEFDLDWDTAWDITTKTISYTNHTILPEALEKWPVEMYRHLLPRVFQITEEIDRRFKAELNELCPNDYGKMAYMSIIEGVYVKMANLAIVGSYSVNGVAAVHSEILKTQLFSDFYSIYPDRFNNKTNGITHRRWLLDSNPDLSHLIIDAIGNKFIKEPLLLNELVEKNFHKQKVFLQQLGNIKHENKISFSNFIESKFGSKVDPNSIYDVQVKRLHAYKRQLLKALQILDMYFTIKDNRDLDVHPVTFMFGGKAAPSYTYAKLIIKLINSIGALVNADPDTNQKMKVVFLENYNVSLAQRIFPASDISEQISTASKEASGTGNMKFMMNGAITVGTMDGANIEIAEAVGPENIITFGLSVKEVLEHYRHRNYKSSQVYHNNPRLKRVVDGLINGTITDTKHEEFMPIYNSLVRDNDEYFVLEDFDAYLKACKTANDIYKLEPEKWLSMSAVNIAKSGRFSSDETIKKYAAEIWHVEAHDLG